MTDAIVQQAQVPNTGRIIDYWRGGAHHLPADAEAAKAFCALYPGFPQVYQTLQEFIGRAVQAIAEQGVNQFLLLGAGIPTQGNVHEILPEARVLYTDIDAINIALGNEILATTPGVGYAYCDATDLGTLDQETMERVLDPTAPIGIVMTGITVSLDDDAAQKALSHIFDWASRGSYLAVDFDGEALATFPVIKERILDQADKPLHLRGPHQIHPLLGRWRVTGDGVGPVDTWRNPGPQPDKVFMYGCVAHKP